MCRRGRPYRRRRSAATSGRSSNRRKAVLAVALRQSAFIAASPGNRQAQRARRLFHDAALSAAAANSRQLRPTRLEFTYAIGVSPSINAFYPSSPYRWSCRRHIVTGCARPLADFPSVQTFSNKRRCPRSRPIRGEVDSRRRLTRCDPSTLNGTGTFSGVPACPQSAPLLRRRPLVGAQFRVDARDT
jgi:hypothetical protein